MIQEYKPSLDTLDNPSGYYIGMPFADYLSIKAASKSTLDLIHRSPAHYRYAPKKDQTRPMTIGSAVHKAILEPDTFFDHYRVTSALKRTDKAYRDAVSELGPDYTLTTPEGDKITGMMDAVWRHKRAAELLRECPHKEVSGFVVDPISGLLCKHRPDAMGDSLIVDLKKCQDARPDAFSRAIAAYRYHVQAALYSDQHEWITGNVPVWYFIAVEEDPPHAVMVYELELETLQFGRRAYRRDLDRLAECRKHDKWPAYGDEAEVIGLPYWVVDQELNELEVAL